jgi:NAD(P)-dependent dehydrogenase (short-subunit alcohol dehydrogenase family)
MRNPFSYEGKRVVVTGAATGVGAALIEVLAELDAAHVTVLDVKKPSGPHDTYLESDLSKEAEIATAVAAIDGSVHALFNNAGVADTSPPHTVIGVNYLAFAQPVGGAARSHPRRWRDREHRVDRGWSVADARRADQRSARSRWLGPHTRVDRRSPRRARRAAVLLSKELVQVYTMRSSRPTIRKGIRTNSVCPSPIDTPLLTDFRATMTDKLIDWNIGECNGRTVTPREVATVLAFLGSDAAAYVNGVNLLVDAGFTAAMTTGQVDFSALA